jgi:zinc protease
MTWCAAQVNEWREHHKILMRPDILAIPPIPRQFPAMRMITLRLALLGAFIGGLLAAILAIPALAQEKLISDRVFYIHAPKSTSIQFQMIVMAGSADETNMAQLGIAHYLEHVVLVGRNEGQGETAVKFFADGSANGWTSQRATGYIHRFPANATDANERLDRLFKFYANRLTDFAITPEDAVRERNVVRQEHDWRYASNPFDAVWQEVTRYSYEGHPFADWTIGTPQTIGAFTVDEARNFLRRWYRKSNVYFIVTGPLAPEPVKIAAEKHLNPLDASLPPVRVWPGLKLAVKPETKVFTRQDKRITTPSTTLSSIVSTVEADPVRQAAVVAVISGYLSSKLSGSPHSALVEGDAPVAATINGAYLARSLPGTLTLSLGAIPEEGRSIDEVRKALLDYRASFLKRGIDAATLERLKKRYARDLKRGLEEPENAPQRLIGWLTTPLPYETLKDWPDVIASVRLDEVSAMLKSLGENQRDAVVIFEPTRD